MLGILELIGAMVVYLSVQDRWSATSPPEEREWIQAFLNGDRPAFDRLVLTYKDRIFNLCYRLLGSREDADDCAQETFVRVYRSLKGFRFDASFSTWVHTIAVNTCKNRLKSAEYRQRRNMVVLGILAENPGRGHERIVEDIEDPAPSVLTRLARQEMDVLIQKAIDELAPDARTVVVLRDVEGLSYEEISQATGYNQGTVKSKLSRARAQLRDKLKGVL